MAVQTRTIKKTDGQYSTIASWEAATNLNSGTDIWKGVISDNEEYNENVTIDTVGSSLNAYVWLTSDPANRHAGVAGTGHARIRGSAGGHVLTIAAADYARVDWLEIQQDSDVTSDEAIRINSGAENILLSYLILWTDNVANEDMDGIYWGTGSSVTVSIDNSIIYGWGRAGIHSQNTGATPTVVANIDHVAVWNCGIRDSNGSGGIVIRSDVSGVDTTFNIYNTWAADIINASAAADEPMHDQDNNITRLTPQGPTVWNGSHYVTDFTLEDDIDGTNNMTNKQSATDGVAVVTKSSGAWIVVNNVTAGSVDLLPLDAEAGNLLAANGTDRQGNEPDARQDFSIDITGATRPTTGVDIGPAQFGEAANNAVIDASSAVTASGTLFIPAPQVLLPDADQAVGSWTTAPLFSKVDDDSASGDGVEITSDAVGNGANTTFADFGLSTAGDPSSSASHVLRARWRSISTRDIDGHLELWEGVPGSGTLRATLTQLLITDTVEIESSYTLSAGEADAITDYTNLYLRLYGTGASGGPDRNLVVDLVDFTIPPDASSPDKSGDGAIPVTSAVTSTGSGAKSGDGAISVTSSTVASGTAIEEANGTGTISATSSTVASGTALEAANGTGAIAVTSSTSASGAGARAGDSVISVIGAIPATGTSARSSDVAIGVSSSVTATGAALRGSDASIAVSSSVVATGNALEAANGSGAIEVSSTVVASGAGERSGDAAIAGSTAALADGTAFEFHNGTGAIPVSSSVTATGSYPRSGDGLISVSSTASASGTPTEGATGSGIITATSSTSASGHMEAAGAATISGATSVPLAPGTPGKSDSAVIGETSATVASGTGAHAGLGAIAVSSSVSASGSAIAGASGAGSIAVTSSVVPTGHGERREARGAGVTLNGGNEEISVPDFDLVGDLTIEFWIKPADTLGNRRNPIEKRYYAEFALTSNTNGSMTYYHGENGGTSDWESAAVAASGTFVDGVWTHVMVTREGQEFKPYINGVLYAPGAKTFTKVATDSDTSLRIGDGYVAGWDGILDDISIYKRALTPAEVREHWETRGQPEYDAVVAADLPEAWWKLDELTGTFGDASGNGHTGTHIGGGTIDRNAEPHTASQWVTGAIAVVASGTAARSGAAAINETATLTASGSAEGGVGVIAVSSSTAASGTLGQNGTATFSASSSVVATGTKNIIATAAIEIVSAVVAIGRGLRSGLGIIAATSAVLANGTAAGEGTGNDPYAKVTASRAGTTKAAAQAPTSATTQGRTTARLHNQ